MNTSESIVVPLVPRDTGVALFRPEALAAQQSAWLGQISIASSPRLWLTCAVTLLLAAALIAFAAFGSYTRYERVEGQVVGTLGIAKIYPPYAGTIVKRLVADGDKVHRGQALVMISAERVTQQGLVQEQVAATLEARKNKLANELDNQKALFVDEAQMLKQQKTGKTRQIQAARAALKMLHSHLVLNDDSLSRYRDLAAQGFFSQTQLAEKQQENLEIRERLEAMRRDLAALDNEVAEIDNNLASLPLREKNQLSNIERSLASVAQEIIDNEAKREVIVQAPVDGQVTAVLGEVGQLMAPERVLLSVIPESSKFQVHLFVPSRAVGFIKPNTRVLVRYQAFPYQKFGQYGATVKEISNTALQPDELKVLGMEPELIYRVKLELDQQGVSAYGEPMTLQDGMKLEADILVETRRIYEWMLDPLYSVAPPKPAIR